MATEANLLEMLSSDNTQVRKIALDRLCDSHVTSEPIITALEKATHDENPQVAGKAIQALQSEVHRKMAAKMGIATPEETKVMSIKAIEEVPSWFRWCQVITLFPFCLTIIMIVITVFIDVSLLTEMNLFYGILLAMSIIYIGLQIYAIIRFGVEDSFSFLQHIHLVYGGRGPRK
jgi:hypothetical protein